MGELLSSSFEASPRLVEQDDADAVLDAPQHPYTQALMAAVPDLGRVVV